MHLQAVDKVKWKYIIINAAKRLTFQQYISEWKLN